MNKLPFISFAVDEHLGDTLMLSLEEDACYTRLMLQAWRNGGYLPNDDDALATACRISVTKWLTLRSAVERLFEVSKRGWHQPKMLEKLAEISAKIEKRKAAGKAGGKASALKAKQNQGKQTSNGCSSNYNYNQNHTYNHNLESNNLDLDSLPRARAYEEAKPEVRRTMPEPVSASDPDDEPPSWQDEAPLVESEDAYGYDDGLVEAEYRLREPVPAKPAEIEPIAKSWIGLSEDAKAHLAWVREKNAREAAMQKEELQAKEASTSRQSSSSEGLSYQPAARDWSDATHNGSEYVCRGTYEPPSLLV